MTQAIDADIDDEIIVALSDYLDGTLPAERKADVEAKLASDPAWQAAHADMLAARDAISGLHLAKARAPDAFTEHVTETIAKRSAGRFFGRKTFGDRVPFGAILVVALLGLALLAYVWWSSPTGSLKREGERPAPPPHGGSAIVSPP